MVGLDFLSLIPLPACLAFAGTFSCPISGDFVIKWLYKQEKQLHLLVWIAGEQNNQCLKNASVCLDYPAGSSALVLWRFKQRKTILNWCTEL